ncbi:MAG: CoA transferase subunit A [Bacteroidales bacterium]|nr:CoA transferase subunit A [Bacteroidales bacterium]MBR6161763.1 CoA transferase subunit A [Bacteroidales bacterium]
MSKVISIEEAVSHVKDGMTIMFGGFLGAGTAVKLVEAIAKKGVKNLTLIGNDTAYPNKAIGMLISNHQVKKLIASHIGTNADTIQQFNDKELEIEFAPQGTLAERIRCGGAGLGGVLTRTGLGTVVEQGKRKIEIDGKEYLLEMPLHADVALIGASICDTVGNCIYKGTTQNFNPMMATAADLVIVETKELVEVGTIPMEQVHTPGIYVDYIVQ